MTRKDPFNPAFDGLPLLSDDQFGGLGLFLLRFSYLLIASMPLVLAMLDAIAGLAANVLYGVGMCALLFPFLLDCLRKFHSLSSGLDSLLILLSSIFLIWNKNYFEAAVLVVMFHFCDVFLCALLRKARQRCVKQAKRVLYGAARVPEKDQPSLHLEAGEVLGIDCRVTMGEAVCSLCYLDPENGEFEVSKGDVLFSGTEIVDGFIDVEPLSEEGVNGVRAIRKKLRRCLSAPSHTTARLSSVSVNLQTFYLLFVLMNITFFDIPVSAVTLAFSSVFFCFDFFLRMRRALEFELLYYCLRHGIFPESMDVLWSLPHRTYLAKFLGGASQFFAPEGLGRRFIIRGRKERRSLLVLERASESSSLITGCDIALLYRTSSALSDTATLALEASILYRFCSLLLLSGVTLTFLLLDLSGKLWVSALILPIFVLVSALSISFAFTKTKR